MKSFDLAPFISEQKVYTDVSLFEVAQLALPSDWDAQLVVLAEERAKPVEIDGSHPTSREDGTEIVSYKQLGGVVIQEECPWLFEAYYDELLALAQQACGDEVLTNDDPRDVMNILLHAPGERGEAHVDNAPVSLLLYPQPAEEGGRLFVTGTDTRGYDNIIGEGQSIDLDKDTGIIFRGDRYGHVSEVNKGSTNRVVVNMNYHLPGQLRDTSLRDYSEPNQD